MVNNSSAICVGKISMDIYIWNFSEQIYESIHKNTNKRETSSDDIIVVLVLLGGPIYEAHMY